MLTEKQQTNGGGNLPSLLSTKNQPTNFGNFSASSVIDPALIPRRESRSISLRPVPSRGAFDHNLTPFSHNLNSGPKPYESVERKARGEMDNVDNWRRIERGEREEPVQMDFSARKGRASVDNITQRDSKRPSERPRDREYQRRFSGGFPKPTVRNDAVDHDRSPPPIPIGGAHLTK